MTYFDIFLGAMVGSVWTMVLISEIRKQCQCPVCLWRAWRHK